MSFFDLMSMSLGSLWRRKLRTILTILGVLIGTASIVAMLSLALGMKKMIMDEYASMGSATQISVNPGDSYSEGDSGSNSKLNLDTMLTDSNLEMFSQMDHVESATPVLDYGLNLKVGKYTSYATLRGVDQSVLDDVKLAEGEKPQEGGSILSVIAGNSVLTAFGYVQGDEYVDYYSTGTLPNIDLMRQLHQGTYYDEYSSTSDTGSDQTEDTTMEAQWDTDASTDGSDSSDSTDSAADDGSGDAADTGSGDGTNGDASTEDNSEKMFNLKVTGIMEGTPDEYKENSDALLVNIDAFKKYLTKTFGKANIPGQPKDNGKPLKDWVYTGIQINVDDSSNVEEVQQNLQDMGFQASSNKELLESAQKNLQIVELVLGGIGMVAFLVAAIGIANTMMMSTYERTKEIGVMKVLGCDMRDIQKLFLTEAAFIGFIGGVVGLGFTCIISYVINQFAQSSGGMNGNISQITWWLALVAVAFSTVMGMLAGYFPARRAMKLSPLAAIHTE